MEKLIECYKRAHPDEGSDVIPDLVADWAITKPELWQPVPVSPRDQLCRLIARSLKDTYMEDPQGREVRANHPIFEQIITAEGVKYRAHYYPLFDSPAEIARVFFSWKRKAALNDVLQMNLDFESWLDNNKFGDTLEKPDYNFNLDLEEMKEPTEYPEDAEPDEEED